MYSVNVDDLVTRTSQYLEDQGIQLKTRLEYIDALNEAQYMLCEKLRMFHKRSTLSSTNGTQSISLPSDYMALYTDTRYDDSVAVKYTDALGSDFYLVQSDYDDVRGNSDLTTKIGTPQTYWIQDNHINFYPTPNYSGTGNISIEHYYYVPDLDGGSETSTSIYTTAVNYSPTDLYDTILCNATLTITLPNAINYPELDLMLKNIGTGTVTIATTSSQTIDGETVKYLSSQYQKLRVISDGANWLILDE